MLAFDVIDELAMDRARPWGRSGDSGPSSSARVAETAGQTRTGIAPGEERRESIRSWAMVRVWLAETEGANFCCFKMIL